MKDITYIDCYTSIGRRGPKDENSSWRTEDLIEEMEHCGIHGSVVLHALSREYDPIYGNRALLKELEKSKRFYGCWSAMPHHCPDFPKPDDFIKMMKDNNINCVTMFPKLHHFDFTPGVCGSLIEKLCENEIPLFIQCGFYENYVQTTFKEIDDICTAFPTLKLIMLSTRYEQPRQIIPLMQKHKNIYIEFSAFQINRGIEWFSELFGSERLLFGSEFPEKTPGAAKSFVDYAQISTEDRKNIAGKNISRLLKIEKAPDNYPEKIIKDNVLHLAQEGKTFTDYLVIDSHAHMSHDKGEGVGFHPQKNSSIEGIIDRNRLIGIDKICISSWLAICADYEMGNEIVYDAIKKFPNDVIGYAVLEPNYVTDWEMEIKRVHEHYKFKGLKPYKPKMLLPYNSPKFDKWYDFANCHDLFALMHPVDNFKNEMLDITERFPNIHFILAHSGWSYKTAKEHLEIAKERKNVSLEITFTAVTHGIIDFMAKEIGADRVLFGTDQPMRDPIPQFGWVVYSHLNQEDKLKVLGQNMKKIIDRCKI